MISSDLLLALFGGALAGCGVLLLVASLVGWAPREAAGPTLTDRLAPADIGRRLLLGGGLALVALLASGWLVVAIGVGLLGFFATKLFGGAAHGRAEVLRLEALASWTESLRTRSPARSGWSRRSRRRTTPPRPSSSRRWGCSSTGCTPESRCPTRC